MPLSSCVVHLPFSDNRCWSLKVFVVRISRTIQRWEKHSGLELIYSIKWPEGRVYGTQKRTKYAHFILLWLSWKSLCDSSCPIGQGELVGIMPIRRIYWWLTKTFVDLVLSCFALQFVNNQEKLLANLFYNKWLIIH